MATYFLYIENQGALSDAKKIVYGIKMQRPLDINGYRPCK
jgi:hypothetical protein